MTDNTSLSNMKTGLTSRCSGGIKTIDGDAKVTSRR